MTRDRRTRIAVLLAALLGAGAPVAAQSPETEYDGAAALGLALRRIGSTGRVLMIGAHPDDEDTALLSALALERGADVAYLSLTRGEGGQNGIGPELQEALGLLRSEELLAARRLDGAVQFFTRAYDFGFSKSADEAFRHWPRDSLLADVVAVVRAFRPDVIIAVFSGTPRDGHGQHQAAGILARAAFEAAGDPARFPAQLHGGLLRPHAPRALYQARRRGDEGAVVIATGELDPLLGRSYYQIAMASRSRHRSQDMGRVQPPGPREDALLRIAPGGRVDGLFAGIDTTLAGRARASAGRRAVPAEAAAALSAYDDEAARLRASFDALAPDRLVPGLARALAALRRADALLADAVGEAAAELRFHIAAERDDVVAALTRAGRIVVDAIADDERVVPGQAFELELSLWNGGRRPVAASALAPILPAGWQAAPLDPLPTVPVAPGALLTRRFRVRVPGDAAPTEPYFLRRPRSGDLYVWPDAEPVALARGDAGFSFDAAAGPAAADAEAGRLGPGSGRPLHGRPFDPPPVRAAAQIELAGERFEVVREATYRGVDPARGEFRRPIHVVPHVAVELEPAVAALPLADAPPTPIRLTLRLAAEAPRGIAGALRFELPAGWRAEPDAVPLRFAAAGERRVVEVMVHPAPAAAPGEYALAAVFRGDDGRRFGRGYRLVDYPHIRPRPIYRAATASVRAFDVRVPERLRVGYIAGAGDDGPQAIAQLGVTVELLDAAALAAADLDGYDVIVTGIRAYEVRPDLVAYNRRLLEYVERGGTLVVQYNQYEFADGGFAAYPLTIARPHDRVTDETAPVEFLEPEHPILSWPNRITDADFEGWIQDRGLYFAHDWDDRYTPLLAMNDPGEAPLRGGLLVAPYGEGTYVYTGLAFFRQIPAGVPGAYRLLANLLALGAR